MAKRHKKGGAAHMMKPISGMLATVLFGILVGACSDVPAALRRHTYPPNFKYIDREQLQSTMWQLADTVHTLDRLMREPGPIDPTRRAQVRRLLGTMIADTHTLQAQGRPTNHPLLSENMEGFERDVAQALAGVEAEPPNYYLVGTVSGACLTCHSPE